MPKKTTISRKPQVKKPVVQNVLQESSSEEISSMADLERVIVKNVVKSQQKTVRLDPELHRAVKKVAESVGMTEQDFITEAIKKEVNKHLEATKRRLMAEISEMPSSFQ